ncbi:MAG: DUF2442 domain-containing protein [Candidatus Binatia bacterium]|nr:DUF2442 domain-containing protein [Candidatus Binatia bacterium]
MKSKPRGKSTLQVEVTNISRQGLWIFLQERELFVPFNEFSWFRNATIDSILKVELPHPRHLYWPDLDVDLDVESIEHPERFPLLSKGAPNGRE